MDAIFFQLEENIDVWNVEVNIYSFFAFLMKEVNIYLMSLGGTEYIFDYQNFSKRLTTNFYHKLLTSSNLSYKELTPKRIMFPSKASTLDCPPG